MGWLSKTWKKITGWLIPEPPKPDGINIQQTGTNKGVPIIYGFVKQAPCIKVLKMTTDKAGGAQNEYLHYVCVFSVGEIEEIGELFFNDISETEINKTKPDSFYIERFNGADTQSPCTTLTSEFPQWKATAQLKGVAYAYVRLKQNKKLDWWQGEPRISADIKGLKVLDPRTDLRAYSSNSALCAYDYLINAKYGKGLTTNKIKTASFIAAADFIDQNDKSYENTIKALKFKMVDGLWQWHWDVSTVTITEPVFTCNVNLDPENTIKENVEILLGGIRAILPETDGKYRIAIEKDDTPVFAFTKDKLVGAIQCKGGSQSERYNQVIIKFRNVLTGKDDEAFFPDDDTLHQTWKAEDSDKLLLGEFEFKTINTKAEALQMGHVIAHRSRQLIGALFSGTPETLVVEAGDVITLDSTILGWNAKPFRIESVSIDLEDGAVDFQAVEHQNSIYPWAVNDVTEEYTDTSLASPFRIDAPANLQYHTVIMGAIQGYFSWDDVQNTAIRNWAIELVNSSGTTVLSTVSFEPRLDLTTIPVGTYTASVYAENLVHRSSAATKTVNITIAPTIVGADITDYDDNRIKNTLAIASANNYTNQQVGNIDTTVTEQGILDATNWLHLPFSGADVTDYNDHRVSNGQVSLDIDGYLSYLDSNNNPVNLGRTTIAGLGYSGALNATANQTDSAANLIASNYADTAESNAVARSAVNLIDTSGVGIGAVLPYGGLTVYGTANVQSNVVKYQAGPFGNLIPVIEFNTEVNQDPSGGWSGGFATTVGGSLYDNKATYRFSCWVYRDTNEQNFYMGYGSYEVMNLGTLTNNTNPYSFPSLIPPSAGKWYLLVAVTHGTDYAGTTKSGDSGWWDPVTGKLVTAATEFRLRSDANSLTFRISQYRTQVGCKTAYFQPLVQKLDGSETPIPALLMDPSNIDAAHVGLGNVTNGADITSDNVAASIAGQGALATQNSVNLNSNEITNKSLAALDSTANTKLGGIANNSTVGATIGQNLSGGFDSSNIANFFAASVIGASIIDVTDLFSQTITAEKLTLKSTHGSDFKVNIDANSNSPISVIDAATNKSVFSVAKVDGEAKALINGIPQNGFISGTSQISDAVIKAINPNYLGQGGLASTNIATVNSGGQYALSYITVNPSTAVSFSIEASSGTYSATAPKWRIRIYRNIVSGTPVYDKTITGYSLDLGGYGSFSTMSAMQDAFVDEGAPEGTSVKYIFYAVKLQGAISTLTCDDFRAGTPAFSAVKPVFKTLYESAGGFGSGNIGLTEPYTNFDFLVVTGSDDGDDFIETVMYPVQAIEDDIANSDYDDFMLWTGYGSNYWRVSPNAERTYLTDIAENAIIHKIQGMNIGGS